MKPKKNLRANSINCRYRHSKYFQYKSNSKNEIFKTILGKDPVKHREIIPFNYNPDFFQMKEKIF